MSRGVQKLNEKSGGIDGYIFQIAKSMSATENVVIIDRKYESAQPSIECSDGMKIIRLSVPDFKTRSNRYA